MIKSNMLAKIDGMTYEVDIFDSTHYCIREFGDSNTPRRTVAVFDFSTEGLDRAENMCRIYNGVPVGANTGQSKTNPTLKQFEQAMEKVGEAFDASISPEQPV